MEMEGAFHTLCAGFFDQRLADFGFVLTKQISEHFDHHCERVYEKKRDGEAFLTVEFLLGGSDYRDWFPPEIRVVLGAFTESHWIGIGLFRLVQAKHPERRITKRAKRHQADPYSYILSSGLGPRRARADLEAVLKRIADDLFESGDEFLRGNLKQFIQLRNE